MMLLANDVKMSPTATVTAPPMLTRRQLNFSVIREATGPAKKVSAELSDPIHATKRIVFMELIEFSA